MENMKRKKSISPVVIQRYFEALKRVEEITKDGFVEISLHVILIQSKINCKTASILVEKGIVKRQKSNINKRAFAYKWNTIKPSLQMAKAVIEEGFKNNVNKIQEVKLNQPLKQFELNQNKIQENALFNTKQDTFEKEFIQPFFEGNRIEQKQTRKRKEIKTEEKKEISLFWGLFKYKSNK